MRGSEGKGALYGWAGTDVSGILEELGLGCDTVNPTSQARLILSLWLSLTVRVSLLRLINISFHFTLALSPRKACIQLSARKLNTSLYQVDSFYFYFYFQQVRIATRPEIRTSANIVCLLYASVAESMQHS